MKLEHFGMAEPGDCRLVFTADAEELERAITAEQAAPDAPQAEEDLLTAAVNHTILEGFSALYEQITAEYGVTPVTDPDFELLAVNRAEGFRAGAQFYALPPLTDVPAALTLQLTVQDVEAIDTDPAALGQRLVTSSMGKRWLFHPRAETFLARQVALLQRVYRK